MHIPQIINCGNYNPISFAQLTSKIYSDGSCSSTASLYTLLHLVHHQPGTALQMKPVKYYEVARVYQINLAILFKKQVPTKTHNKLEGYRTRPKPSRVLLGMAQGNSIKSV